MRNVKSLSCYHDGMTKTFKIYCLVKSTPYALFIIYAKLYVYMQNALSRDTLASNTNLKCLKMKKKSNMYFLH